MPTGKTPPFPADLMDNLLSNCPICGFHDKDPIQVILHVGTEHSITSSIFSDGSDDDTRPSRSRSSRDRDAKKTRPAPAMSRTGRSKFEKAKIERTRSKPKNEETKIERTRAGPTRTARRDDEDWSTKKPQPALLSEEELREDRIQPQNRPSVMLPNNMAKSPPSSVKSDPNDDSQDLADSLRLELLKLQHKIKSSDDQRPVLTECSVCSQLVHQAEYNEHVDVHNQDSAATPTTGTSPTTTPPLQSSFSSRSSRSSTGSSPQTPRCDPDDSTSTIVSTRQNRTQYPVRLLETAQRSYADKSMELGPYCDEKRMPTWLLEQHWNGPPVKKINTVDRHGRVVTRLICENQASGVIDVLARVVSKCEDTDKVYLCHPSVKHVHRMARDGPFCGYFNIQMIISHLQATQPVANALFQNGLPTVLDLQDMIEEAWDQGFSEYGREETGGIRGTRKWIGTPEVEALFHCKGYRCQNTIFRRTRQDPRAAYEQLLDFVETYFKDGKTERKSRARLTDKAPLYLQQPGHSMTIVGLEVRNDGLRELLVFNPSFGPTSRMRSLLDGTDRRHVSPRAAERMMDVYRRSPEQLARYEDFEIIQVTMPTWVYPRHTIPDRNKFLLAIGDAS